MTDISIAYYGYLFDASGYGHATRAYIHALHRAGVGITAIDLIPRGRQVRDPLVESLVDRRASVDLHFFHGIPSEWAHLAFAQRNAVGMTTWETDTMPVRWRNAVNHVRELWLPCEANVHAFQRSGISTSIYCLPHPVPPWMDESSPEVRSVLGTAREDFVVYSIFEWQERKNPVGMLQAFLSAFADEPSALLVFKTNPGAAQVAARTVEEVRQRTPSRARVELHAAAWDEAQLSALHARGNCYLSLHRGEGWGYPLFEAAARGVPVVATAYSGPLDYLSPSHHGLVRCSLTNVRQRYAFYDRRMRWAEPDVAHAIELLRAAYREQTLTRARAQAGAVRIRERFSLERVGADARDRLIILRDARRSGRQLSLRSTVPAPVGHLATPPIPVPPSWYDADYFEHGVKSNWTRGYHWSLFAGLFRATATLLCELFPHNESFLDAGCAKGFLIRALIERGRDCTGFDHSRWAVDHAERMAAPHIACVGAAEYTFPRPVDVLLAFDLLSHLTEDEAEAFLRRARAHVSRSLFATLPSERVSASDRDRTHVNRRDRAWWSALLARTGWRHDAASDALEYSSQQHALTQRMDWIVIVASPGAAVEAERFQASVDQVGVA